MSMNNIVVIGRLTRDPETTVINDASLCKFAIAVDRDYKGSDGESPVDFFDVDAWRKLGEVCANNLNKGRLVAVSGPMYSRTWEDKETGQKRRSWSISANKVQFLDWPKDNEQSGPNTDDDVPF